MAGRSKEGDGYRPPISGADAIVLGLFRDHYERIKGMIGYKVSDPQTAEDLAQITFLRAWRARKSLRDPQAAGNWLNAIAHRAIATHYRDQKGIKIIPSGIGNEVIGHAETNEDIIFLRGKAITRLTTAEGADEPLIGDSRIAEMLVKLPPRQRQAVYFHVVCGLDYKEAAEKMGVGIGSVKSHCFRGIASLQRMAKEGDIDLSK